LATGVDQVSTLKGPKSEKDNMWAGLG